MENRIAIPLLCLAAIAYACGPWRHTPSPHIALNADDLARTKDRVATIFNVVPSDSHVEFGLHVLNNTEKTVELQFPNGKTHDFVVMDMHGNVVWRWSEGRMFTQAVQSKRVKASDMLSIVDGWTPSNAHGKYIAVATLNTEDKLIERRVTFTLP